MQKRYLILFIFSLFLFSACSPKITVQTDAVKGVKLEKISSYQLELKEVEKVNAPIYENDLNARRIQTALNRNLQARGYKMEDKNPDLLIYYTFQVKSKTRIDGGYPYDFYYYYPYRLRDIPRTENYEVGELVLEFKLGSTKETIWVGAAMDILAGGIEGLEERLEKATNKLLTDLSQAKDL